METPNKGLVEIWEKPEAEEMVMLVGWRQWADAGTVSSGLPDYLVQQSSARRIGRVRPDGFYLFQIPGTHDLVRPVVRFEQGFPESLETQHNDLYYAGDERRGMVVFLGDEPHMDAERYVGALLDAAQELGVKRLIGFGGVYGEAPYEKERAISCSYSLHSLREEVDRLAVNLSEYQGGASIGSYVCRRAGERGMEYIGLYAFAPAYEFPSQAEEEEEEDGTAQGFRIETDYTAWLGVMKRVNYLTRLNFDLTDLAKRSEGLIALVDAKVDELEASAPHLQVREYLRLISENFTETLFEPPLDEVWEDEIRRLFDKFEDE